jgi:hypothetical protein
MKRWFSGKEMRARWDITSHDLVEIIIAGDIVAHYPGDHSPIDVDIDAWLREDVRFYRSKLGSLGAGLLYSSRSLDSRREDFKVELAQSLIASADHLQFRIEQILKYEKDHNLDVEAQGEGHPSPPEAEPQYFFFKKGSTWEVGFDGERAPIPHLLGMKYIVYLLQRAGMEVSVHDLYRIANPPPENTMTASMAAENELHTTGSVPMLTPTKVKLIVDRYEDLQARLEDEIDIEKREDIENEMEKLNKYLNDISKQASMASGSNQRCQANVRKAIDRAREVIRKAGLTDLAQHLEKNIKPGGGYSYKYNGDILWKLSE